MPAFHDRFPHRRLGRTAFASVLALTAVLASQACSTSTSAPTGTSALQSSGPPDTEHFASALASSFCDSLGSCCTAAHYAYDGASCTAQMQAQFQGLVDAVKYGTVVYDATAAAACAQAIQAAEGSCSSDAGAAPGNDAGSADSVAIACGPVFKGKVLPGASCHTSTECASPSADVQAECYSPEGGQEGAEGACYQFTTNALPGSACSVEPIVGTYTYAECQSDVGYCDTSNSDTNATGTCKAYVPLGASCNESDGIVLCNLKTAYCNQTTALCATSAPLGGSCPVPEETVGCLSGLYCGSTNTCVPFKAAGDVCQQSTECSSGQCEQTENLDGGFVGACAPNETSPSESDVSPRSCGFGPASTGPEDAGIQAAATQSVPVRFAHRSPWWRAAMR